MALESSQTGNERCSLQTLLRDGAIWFGENKELLLQPPLHSRSECSAHFMVQESFAGADKERIAETSSPETTPVKKLIAPFGIPEIDRTLLDCGLSFGALHEWFIESEIFSKAKDRWHPPLHVLCALMGNALHAQQTLLENSLGDDYRSFQPERQLIVWIGKRCFPTPTLLQQTLALQNNSSPDWQARSIFISPKERKKSTRAAIIAEVLRSPLVFAVVADGSGIAAPQARRLQFAAREGGALALLCRPAWEQRSASTAQTRWSVRTSADSSFPAWELTLLRARGLVAQITWSLEWFDHDNRKTNSLRLSSGARPRASGEKSAEATTDVQQRPAVRSKRQA